MCEKIQSCIFLQIKFGQSHKIVLFIWNWGRCSCYWCLPITPPKVVGLSILFLLDLLGRRCNGFCDNLKKQTLNLFLMAL